MKITCSKVTLTNNINIVSKTVAVRSSLKILECILITAESDSFVMFTNDMEMCSQTSPAQARVDTPGSVALDAKLFSEIVRKMPDGDITIDCDYNLVTEISSGKVRFKIVGQNAEDFPQLPAYETDSYITLKADCFKDMIKKTIFSLSQDSDKPIFKGELFEVDTGYLNMVSVDGFRISYARSKVPQEINASVIVPGKALNEMIKILPDNESELKIFISDNHIIFKMDAFIFISRLLSGDFLNYKQSFPGDYTTKVIIKKADFLVCLERSLLISQDTKKHPVHLKFENNTVSITSQTENGSLYDEIDTQTEGQNMEIAFNPRYLIDTLKACDEDTVSLFMTSPLSPCIIRNEDNMDNKFLILPLRIK